MRLPGRVVVPLKSMCSSTWDKPAPSHFLRKYCPLAPRLGRNNRRAMIFAHDQHQPVFQRNQFHIRRKCREYGRRARARSDARFLCFFEPPRRRVCATMRGVRFFVWRLSFNSRKGFYSLPIIFEDEDLGSTARGLAGRNGLRNASSKSYPPLNPPGCQSATAWPVCAESN